MKHQQSIKVYSVEKLAALIAEFVKSGITFEAHEMNNEDYFLIVFTGGY